MVSIINFIRWTEKKSYKKRKEKFLERTKEELYNLERELNAFIENENYKRRDKYQIINMIEIDIKKIKEIYQKIGIKY